MSNFAFTLVMMPPRTPVRRQWAKRLAEDEIGVRVLQPDTVAEAMRDIVDADPSARTPALASNSVRGVMLNGIPNS